MLRQAWNDYRGWAKLARDLQTETQRWNLAAVVLVIAAAVFGAIASVAPEAWSSWVAGAAAMASAVGAYLGRQIVGSGDEAGWIQARAAAEGIKSECYRYAARAGAYAPDPSASMADTHAAAAKALLTRTTEIAKAATAHGLVRADNPILGGGSDKREPADPMTKDWYVAGRIKDQIKSYQEARARNQAKVSQQSASSGGSPSLRSFWRSSSGMARRPACAGRRCLRKRIAAVTAERNPPPLRPITIHHDSKADLTFLRKAARRSGVVWFIS